MIATRSFPKAHRARCAYAESLSVAGMRGWPGLPGSMWREVSSDFESDGDDTLMIEERCTFDEPVCSLYKLASWNFCPSRSRHGLKSPMLIVNVKKKLNIQAVGCLPDLSCNLKCLLIGSAHVFGAKCKWWRNDLQCWGSTDPETAGLALNLFLDLQSDIAKRVTEFPQFRSQTETPVGGQHKQAQVLGDKDTQHYFDFQSDRGLASRQLT